MRFNLFHLEVFQVQVHVTQTHVPDAFSLRIRDLGRYDIRLFLACTDAKQCLSAERLDLGQSECRHKWLPLQCLPQTLGRCPSQSKLK